MRELAETRDAARIREATRIVELAGTPENLSVSPEEYIRLLGYPRGFTLEGRALELADWARDWYARNGHPWFYARQAQKIEIAGHSIRIDDASFASSRLQHTLEQADAHSVIMVAVSAGSEVEEEARRRWEDQKPDEYFFLEIFASAVVEHLTAITGARLCDWAEQNGMAVLPHSSPGYSGWDVAEQPRLLHLIKQTQSESFPSHLEALDSGMLRPKKSQLAVFGLTCHTEKLRRLTDLVPCESCSFGPCQYRRTPYKRNPPPFGEPLPRRMPMLDQDAAYSVNRKALARWAKERLVIQTGEDGLLDIVFRYDGTTCTNMGRPLSFHYKVKLGPRVQGYPIREQSCAPVPGDTGHTFMCQYLEDPERLMAAIGHEKPLSGARLSDVLSWRRSPSAAGCFCDASSRDHKWGLVLETIHYALVQQEMAEERETS